MKKNKIIALSIMGISLLIPILSFAQGSGDTTATQQLSANSYTFTTPTSITFSPVFATPGEIKVAQKVLTPATSGEIVEFVDLRNSGGFSIGAYINNFSDGETSIPYTSFAIATRSFDGTYSVDMDEDNSITAANETVSAPLDYTGSLTNGEIPAANYTNFPADSGSTSGSLTIINGSTLPEGSSGRVGSFAVAPALKVSVPTDIYGTFTGTLTFELSL